MEQDPVVARTRWRTPSQRTLGKTPELPQLGSRMQEIRKERGKMVAAEPFRQHTAVKGLLCMGIWGNLLDRRADRKQAQPPALSLQRIHRKFHSQQICAPVRVCCAVDGMMTPWTQLRERDGWGRWRANRASICAASRLRRFRGAGDLPEWLARRYAGEMNYLHDARRADPRQALEDARSVVVVALNYNPPSRSRAGSVPERICREDGFRVMRGRRLPRADARKAECPARCDARAIC